VALIVNGFVQGRAAATADGIRGRGAEAVLDETDSGLDIDALKIVAAGVNSLRDPARAVILVTHYQRLLDYVAPDQVHVLAGGRTATGPSPSNSRGYDWLLESAVA
jgi:Fe-S cluster assembly ATP-binding protein